MKHFIFTQFFIFLFISYSGFAQYSFDIVKDAAPSGDLNIQSTKPIVFNGKLFFSANDGTNGVELWMTDGTATGTQMQNINPGLPGSAPAQFTIYNGKLYFAANDGTNGRELWVSDGTVPGTQLLKDINSGSGNSFPAFFAEYSGKLYFAAQDASGGTELWVSDGTPGGTQLLKDINPGSGSSFPYGPKVYNGKLYFVADDGTHGKELWVSDGTSIGTMMVKDINIGLGDAFSYYILIEYNGKLYFSASDGSAHGEELWATDGTALGTQMISDINTGTNNSSPLDFMVYNGKLFFSADDGTHGAEIWTTDGTTLGTQLFKDINVGASDITFYGFYYGKEYKGKLYFQATDATNGVELWVTDGTPSGTQIFKNINPGNGNSAANYLTVYNDRLYFTASDGTNGKELWVTNGMVDSTYKIAPAIAPNADPLTEAYWFGEMNGTLYFPANYNSAGLELWKLTAPPPAAIAPIQQQNFNIYPNPANTATVISFDDNTEKEISLYGIDGRLLMNITTRKQIEEIGTANLTNGLYLLEIKTEKAATTKQLVVKH